MLVLTFCIYTYIGRRKSFGTRHPFVTSKYEGSRPMDTSSAGLLYTGKLTLDSGPSLVVQPVIMHAMGTWWREPDYARSNYYMKYRSCITLF